MLDINLFRVEKGHDPERIRESQRKRFARVELVDEIIDLDKKWRERKFFFLLFSSLLGASIQFCLMGRSASVYPQKISHSMSCVTYGRVFSSLSSDNRAGLRCTLKISAAFFGGWRTTGQFEADKLRQEVNKVNKEIAKKKMVIHALTVSHNP
jgi:hypothetical protein